MNFITEPLTIVLAWIYSLTGSLGWAIIILTIAMRALILPLAIPSQRSQKKMRALQPKLNKLKEQYKDDKTAFAQAQMQLYKDNKVNPLGGCLPMILQLVIFFALYQVLRQFISDGASGVFSNITFLGLDLTQRDPTYILPVLAAGTQLILSLMISPGADTRNVVPDTSKSNKTKDLNKKEDDLQEMAATMQKQMVFMMPVMTGLISASFPAGLGLYWIVTTIFSIIQQWFFTGPGGLTKYLPWLKSTSMTGQEVAESIIREVSRTKGDIKEKAASKLDEKSKSSLKLKSEDAFTQAFLSTAGSGGSNQLASEKGRVQKPRPSEVKKKDNRLAKKKRKNKQKIRRQKKSKK